MFLLEGGRLKITEAPCLEFYDYVIKNEWKLHEGLLGEEKGWHLYEFDDSSWRNGSISGIVSNSGIMWLRKDFSLEIPKDTISPIGLRVSSLGTKCKILFERHTSRKVYENWASNELLFTRTFLEGEKQHNACS
jgi:hypothetical protein